VASNAYRLKDPLIAVIQEDRSHLMELPAGSMFSRPSQKPDSHGMVKGMCKGQTVLLFASDLEECAEQLAQVF